MARPDPVPMDHATVHRLAVSGPILFLDVDGGVGCQPDIEYTTHAAVSQRLTHADDCFLSQT